MNVAVDLDCGATLTPMQTWPERNRQWLIGAIGRLRQRLEARVADPSAPLVAADCVETDELPGFTPALVHLGRAFGLSVFERELLLLAAGLELDQGLRAAVATLNGGASSRASYGLGLATLAAPHWRALSSDSALRQWHMIEPETGPHLTQAALQIDERIVHFVTGVPASDPVLAGVATVVAPGHDIEDEDASLAARIAHTLSAPDHPGAVAVLHDQDRDPALRRDMALAVLTRLSRPGLWLESRDLPADPEALLRLAVHVDREAALVGCLPVVSIDGAGSEVAALRLVARLHCGLLWLGALRPQLSSLVRPRRVLRFDLPPPDAARTRAALLRRWQRLPGAIAADEAATRAALERAARQFHLGPSAIDGIVENLPTMPVEAIWPAAREAARGGLDAIAQRIDSRVTFDDLVLPPGQMAMLRDIARHLRQRDRVYGDWGFGARHQLGQALVALFAGESGTGKTLAAEAVAGDVGLDLYRIDLASVVSKYIGETEKNLKRLFDSAEASGAVLLFDEADALFGKRSEVKDSHDRYANIEIAYLLQRIEAYRGLAILTTNMKGALDQAFLRRIRFIVNFPFPDATAREQIWRRQFPANAPMGEIDFATLARLTLSGGNIRSVAVNAAFKAADNGGLIDQSMLIAAARAEFAKLERSMGSLPGGTA
ncbi:ATP-binding protein [Reyranella sp.]|uniref:ATP-binding protein n=1 Tax=Reyranella sp. TaxID=1929291 RepID=UPI00378440A3